MDSRPLHQALNIQSDSHAPRYHLISPNPRSTCFDPNGALYWHGRYHLFFIHQDPAFRSGDSFPEQGHCWGHISSEDLLHWTLHPAALTPDSAGPEKAIYSGCALVNREGRPTLMYHAVGAGTCLATAADDDLIVWRKHPANPVIPQPQPGEAAWNLYNVFDPHGWLQGDACYAILGGQVKPDDAYDTAYLFRSSDLTHWEYLHPFYQPDPAWTVPGDDCACPDFFALGNQHALMCISHATGLRCYVGAYEKQRFLPQAHYAMNWPGGACFASESLQDGRGRRIFWSWALDQRLDWWKLGQRGVMTLPRTLELEDGRLLIEPVEELMTLRRDAWAAPAMSLEAGRTWVAQGLSGECLEIELEAVTPLRSRLALRVRQAPDSSEETRIIYDPARGELAIDVSRSSREPQCFRPWPMDFWRGFAPQNVTCQTAPLRLPLGQKLRLRVFLDRSMLEVFANGQICLTQRIYPTKPDSVGVSLAAEGGASEICRLQAWHMAAVNL